MNATRMAILQAVVVWLGNVPAQAADPSTEILAKTQGEVAATENSPGTSISELTWPDISDEHDIPLAAIGLGTKLRWAVAFWIPALAATDLPLHVYASSVLDDDLLERAADGWPLFAVLEREEGYVARHFDTAEALRTFKDALAARRPAAAARIYVATPLPLPDRNEVNTLRADFSNQSAGSFSRREPTSDDAQPAADETFDSFDEIYARYPDIRTASKL